MAKWLDRNIYPKNVDKPKTAPDGSNSSATDQPGLKEMTIKALEILHTRNPENGFFLMSEAASIDKQMHTLDYDCALGELLELDDTIKATLHYLESIGELNNTFVLVTADHGHGFDVMGSVDTKFLNAQHDDRDKRGAVGTYRESGNSQYVVANCSAPIGSDQNLVYSPGVNFPANWDPRYTLFQGLGANPDHRENYRVHKDGPRIPALNISGFDNEDFFVNYVDAVTWFIVNGTLPVSVSFVFPPRQLGELSISNSCISFALGRPRCSLSHRRPCLLQRSMPGVLRWCLQQYRHFLWHGRLPGLEPDEAFVAVNLV